MRIRLSSPDLPETGVAVVVVVVVVVAVCVLWSSPTLVCLSREVCAFSPPPRAFSFDCFLVDFERL